MADETRRPRRIVHKAHTHEGPKMIRHTIALPDRLSGLLAYYAQTRRLSESNVVAQALGTLFRGIRIADGGASAGEEEAVE